MYRQIDRCRICGSTDLVEVLDLGVQTLTGVFPRSRDQLVTAGPLRLVKCMGDIDTCGLLQLQHTYDLKELYGDNYGYRSGLNPSMASHLQEKIERILRDQPLLPGALVIDIGANDATTLKAYPPRQFSCVGIDPTAAKFREFYPDHIQLIPEFFSAATIGRHLGDRKAGVITSFAMFYDLEDPLRFMKDIAETLDTDGIWVSEQSYMPLMLRRNAYDTVCHEHLEYYALKQIRWMAEHSGLRVIDVEFNDINGGSFSFVAARIGSRHTISAAVHQAIEAEDAERLDILETYRAFALRVAASRETLLAFLQDARRRGKKVCALGASTKGNVLLQYCHITESDIAAVGEINVDKIGCFTPGAMLPITSEEDVMAGNPDYLMMLPWHFRSFFTSNLRFSGRNLLFALPEPEVVHCA